MLPYDYIVVIDQDDIIEILNEKDKSIVTKDDSWNLHKRRFQTDSLSYKWEEIVTTESHPFYVNNRGFINAGELVVGDELLDLNGNTLLIESYEIELTDEPTTVYNFQVEDFHTYHVIASHKITKTRQQIWTILDNPHM